MKRKNIALILLAVILTLTTSCGVSSSDKSTSKEESQSTDTANEQITFTDDLDQEFTVDKPKRVVAMIGSFADIWLLAGGEDSLVATANDAWESYELNLGKEVANIGSGMKPSAELVLEAQPDLILASTISSSNLDLKETFDKAKIPAAYFNVASFEDYLELLELCTKLTGQDKSYETYGTKVKNQIEDAIAKQNKDTPKVLNLQVSGKSCTVKNSEDNVLGEMLAELGCNNIADQNGALLEDLSLEAIIKADPDYIFAVYHGTDTEGAQKNLEKNLLSNPAWSELRAVKEDHFYILDRRLYNLKPNALWGDAYEELSDILYGEE